MKVKKNSEMRKESGRREILILLEPARVASQGLLRGISRYSLEYGPWILRIDEEHRVFENVIQRIRSWRGDGIISRTWSRSMLRELEKVSCPVVELAGEGHNIPTAVRNDNKKIAELAFEHLHSLGFIHYAFYSYGDLTWIMERCNAFEKIVKEHGYYFHCFSQLKKQKDFSYSLWSIEFEKDLSEWLKSLPYPTALWTPSDLHAVRVQETALRNNIRIPEEIALLGVDNDTIVCNSLVPSLSSIKTDTMGVGYEAARLLHRKMEGKPYPTNFPYRIAPLGIVARQSTDIAAVDDQDLIDALQIIRNEATLGLTVADILKRLDLSSNSLLRRFRKYLGRTPEQEIKRLRIERAKELLQETTASVESIAELSGFGSVEYFAKSFLRETALTPRQFRARYENQSETLER